MSKVISDINKHKFESGENIFFTSDTHFGHTNIIKYCKRPFNSIEEHDETLIKNWNNKVGENDIIFHLGDFAFGSEKKWMNYLEQLNGKKYLIIGNHDWRNLTPGVLKYFENVSQQMNLRIKNTHIWLNHFPYLCFSGAWKGLNASWQLFGHVHTSPYADSGLDHQRLANLFTTQFDVGTDNNNFTPISFYEVKEKINTQMMSLGMCRN